MLGETRRSAAVKLAVCAACLACLLSCLWLAPAAFAAGSEAGVHFTLESMQAYEQQLAGGQIQAAKFNTKARSLHLTLKDGSHVRVSYPPHDATKLSEALKAHGVSVPVIKSATAHHKIRYIAAGVIVLLVILVGAALYIRSRRDED
jgi:hypothetical protein